MSKIDDIWKAYYKGQADAEEHGISGVAFHDIFGHMAGAVLPGGDSDEDLAYEKGYHGEDLDLCHECEHVQENCECENKSDNSDSGKETYSSESYSSGGSGGDDGGSSYESGYESSYESGSGGGGGYTETSSAPWPLGCIAVFLLVPILLCGFIVYEGDQIKQQWAAEHNASKDEHRRTETLPNGQSVINKDSNNIGGIQYVNTKTLNVRGGPGEKYPVVRKAYQGEKILVYGQPEQVGNDMWSVSIGDNPSTRGWVNLKYLSNNQNSQSVDVPTPNTSVASPPASTAKTTKSPGAIAQPPQLTQKEIEKRDADAKLLGFTSNGDGTYSGPSCYRCHLVKAKGNGYLIQP